MMKKDTEVTLQYPQSNRLDLGNYIKANEKCCIICGINGTVKKHTFVLFEQLKVRVCVCCQEKLGGTRPTAQFLEKIDFPKELNRFKKGCDFNE